MIYRINAKPNDMIMVPEAMWLINLLTFIEGVAIWPISNHDWSILFTLFAKVMAIFRGFCVDKWVRDNILQVCIGVLFLVTKGGILIKVDSTTMLIRVIFVKGLKDSNDIGLHIEQYEAPSTAEPTLSENAGMNIGSDIWDRGLALNLVIMTW